MATIVNNPGSSSDSGGYNGLLIGLLLIVALFALIYYGIPALTRSTQQSSPQINVPDKVDVNLNQNQNP